MGHRRRTGLLVLTTFLALLAVITGGGRSARVDARQERAPSPRAAAALRVDPSPIQGGGSSYAALAFSEWTTAGQAQGLNVNYQPSGSPKGLTDYQAGQLTFAGTEAEFSSLNIAGSVSRGYQYIPDVAGAVALMYNLKDKTGKKVNYLHLSRSTIAKIFMGYIADWSDPQITRDNRGLELPKMPIRVVYRSSPSGTTALFYDFVKNIEPALFRKWAVEKRILPASDVERRIIDLPGVGWAPQPYGLGSSEQIAQFIAGSGGLGSIGYDEFGYAKVYNAPVAWVDNGAGRWTQPYAVNITQALLDARLRPDLSQDLRLVHNSRRPEAYAISAYSYIVTQCATGRSTCRGPYRNAGEAETLRRWLRYIACDGQYQMANNGYAPLPVNLSKEVAISIGRMLGKPAELLTAGNCNNPRFRGSLGPGADNPIADPYLGLPPRVGGGGGGGGSGGGAGGGSGGAGGGSGGAGGPAAAGNAGPGGLGGEGGQAGQGAGGAGAAGAAANGSATTAPDAAAEEAASEDAGEGGSSEQAAAVGRKGATANANGGSTEYRDTSPVGYRGSRSGGIGAWPLVVLIALLAMPAVGTGLWRRRRRLVDGD